MIKFQQGTSLIELLVSIFLSTMLLMGLVTVLLGVKRHSLHLESRLERIADLQLVTEFMRDSIRHAGFTPCRNLDELVSYDHQRYQGVLPSVEISAQRLCLRRMSNAMVQVSAIRSENQVVVKNEVPIKEHALVLIADCFHAEVLMTHTIQGRYISLSSPLKFQYQQPIYIGEWLEECFFVRTTHGERMGLYYQAGRADELISGVSILRSRIQQDRACRFVDITLNFPDYSAISFKTAVRTGCNES